MYNSKLYFFGGNYGFLTDSYNAAFVSQLDIDLTSPNSCIEFFPYKATTTSTTTGTDISSSLTFTVDYGEVKY